MIKIEICVQSDSLPDMIAGIRAASAGGADTIELCRDMSADGLTPARASILMARQHFPLPGLMVMIRPRADDFCYSASETAAMGRQIDLAAECGADGVVFGVLRKDGEPAIRPLEKLVHRCKKRNLCVTFHRAFDVARQPLITVDRLLDVGVDRILTSGAPWGSGLGAVDGLEVIGAVIARTRDKIEIVIGGGVSATTAAQIVRALSPVQGHFSLHAYSGVLKNGRTDASLVRALWQAANGLLQ